jgi:hypothetical protein
MMTYDIAWSGTCERAGILRERRGLAPIGCDGDRSDTGNTCVSPAGVRIGTQDLRP